MTAQAINNERAASLTDLVRAGSLKITCSEATLEGGETEWLPIIREGGNTYIYNPEFKVKFAKDLAAEVTGDVMDGDDLDAEDWVVIKADDKEKCERRTITGIK